MGPRPHPVANALGALPGLCASPCWLAEKGPLPLFGFEGGRCLAVSCVWSYFFGRVPDVGHWVPGLPTPSSAPVAGSHQCAPSPGPSILGCDLVHPTAKSCPAVWICRVLKDNKIRSATGFVWIEHVIHQTSQWPPSWSKTKVLLMTPHGPASSPLRSPPSSVTLLTGTPTSSVTLLLTGSGHTGLPRPC